LGVLAAVVFIGPRVVIPRITEAIKMTKDAIDGKPSDPVDSGSKIQNDKSKLDPSKSEQKQESEKKSQ
jgi:hypothetical protein